MSSRTPLLALPCAFLLAVAACGPPGSASDPRPDVVWIVVDTLRADRVGAFGSERGLTPRLDRFCASGVTFTDAQAHAPWTLPSIASMLTSRLPPEHGAGGFLGPDLRAHFEALGPEARTLQEVLAERGWESAAITNVTFLTEAFGVVQAFDELDAQAFESNLEVRSAGKTTDAALRWLAARDERAPPGFLFVHYFDPHAVYDPPAAERARFAPDVPDDFRFGTREDLARLRRGRLELEPAVVARAERLYDAEVAYVDRELGRLLDALSARPATIVVWTSDHGEEFLDHGGFEHGHTVYGELLHVPLAIAAPGLDPARVDAPVGLIDVAPTVLELAGLPSEPAFLGRSLVPAIGGDDAPRALYAEGNMWGPKKTSLRLGSWKLVTSDRPGAAPELYALDRDPAETEDLARRELARVEELEDQLAALRRSFEVTRGERTELDPAARRALEQLGYLGAGDLEDE